jgi:hypothetical protein
VTQQRAGGCRQARPVRNYFKNDLIADSPCRDALPALTYHSDSGGAVWGDKTHRQLSIGSLQCSQQRRRLGCHLPVTDQPSVGQRARSLIDRLDEGRLGPMPRPQA